MKLRLILAVGLLVLAGVSCAPSRLEVSYGTSFQMQKINQILDPEAAKNLKPTEGLDVQAAERSLEKYRKSFEKPPQEDKFLMEIGGVNQ